jgi:tRNA 2-thiouridine synthesizing protein B|tara:strand:- start:980 stop:1288 length:309 start_codon:yes stop_codon:yes gene_type:complete
MPTLHIVNKSPFSQQALLQCLEVIGCNHSLILIEDGCYGGLKTSPAHMQLQKIVKKGIKIYALKDDLRARGLNSNLLEEMTPINMNEMVELCCQHRNVQSWY